MECLKTYTLSASHEHICFGTLVSGIVQGSDSGVQFTTMRRVSAVFDRRNIVVCEGYLGLQQIWVHVQASQEQSVVSLVSPHAATNSS